MPLPSRPHPPPPRISRKSPSLIFPIRSTGMSALPTACLTGSRWGAGCGRLPWVHLWARSPATACASCRPKLAPPREALTWCPSWPGEGLFGASVGLGSPLSLDAGCRSGREAWGWRALPALGQHLQSSLDLPTALLGRPIGLGLGWLPGGAWDQLQAWAHICDPQILNHPCLAVPSSTPAAPGHMARLGSHGP